MNLRSVISFILIPLALYSAAASGDPLQSLDERLIYAEGLLERYPNILRANLQYRRNLLDVLGNANQVSKLLGDQANPMIQRPLSSMTLTYSPGATLTYDIAKVNEAKTVIAGSVDKLPLEKVTTLTQDLAQLKNRSLVNGVFNPAEYKSNLGRFLRLAPVLYDSNGKALPTVSVAPSNEWKVAAKRSIDSFGGAELDNLYNDVFGIHQSAMIENAALTSKNSPWNEALQANSNSFLKKTLTQAVTPSVSNAAGSTKGAARYLKVEEVLSPDDLFRGCFGKDCSILSVPHFPQVKGTKTYYVRKSKNAVHLPDGYAFAVPVEVNGKKIPYIITINGNLTSQDAKKVIQAIGVDWGTSQYVFADFNKTAYLVNTAEMRTGLQSAEASRVTVKLPEGWEKVSEYITKNQVSGYSNYYVKENLVNAFVAPIEKQGGDLLHPIQKSVSLPPPRRQSTTILSRPVLDRAILAADSLDGKTTPEFRAEVMKRLGVKDSQVEVAGRLKGAYMSGIDAPLFKSLETELGFTFKNVSDLDLVTRAKTLNRLYYDQNALAKAETWKSEFNSIWSDIETNWHGASFEERTKLKSFVFDDVFGKMPSEYRTPTPQFVEDAFAWATSGAGGGSDAFYALVDSGHLTDQQILEGLPKLMDSARDFKLPAKESRVNSVMIEQFERSVNAAEKQKIAQFLMKVDPKLADPKIRAHFQSVIEKELNASSASSTLDEALQVSNADAGSIDILEKMDEKYPKLHLRQRLFEVKSIKNRGIEAVFNHYDRFPETATEDLVRFSLKHDSQLSRPTVSNWMKGVVDAELGSIGHSKSLVASLVSAKGDGKALDILKELEVKYPKIEMNTYLLEVPTLGKEGSERVLGYLEKFPEKVTTKAVIDLSTSYTQSHRGWGRDDEIKFIHKLSERILESAPRKTQLSFIEGMLQIYGGSDKHAWGDMWPQKYLKKVGEWIEGMGNLTPAQFREIDQLLSKLKVPEFTTVWYRHPRNLSQFMLDEDPALRRSAITLKQKYARQVLPSAMASERIPTEDIVDAIRRGDYHFLYAKRPIDQFKGIAFTGAIEEVFGNVSIRDPKFFSQLAEWMQSPVEAERKFADSFIFWMRDTQTMANGEKQLIELARKSENSEFVKRMFNYYADQNLARLKKGAAVSPEFQSWCEIIAKNRSDEAMAAKAKNMLKLTRMPANKVIALSEKPPTPGAISCFLQRMKGMLIRKKR